MVLQELGKLLHGFLPGSVTFATQLSPETPWCEADRSVLEQIMLNCANFLRSRLRQDNGSTVLSCQAAPDGQQVNIELRGSGQGLLGLDVEACFTPDLRPTASAYESGTGLFAARVLAGQQRGRLTFVRHDPRTIAFVLQLPVAKT